MGTWAAFVLLAAGFVGPGDIDPLCLVLGHIHIKNPRAPEYVKSYDGTIGEKLKGSR